MKITKLRVTNYRGLEDLSVTVAPSGVIATGGNSRGKSTVLKAVRTVLEARDIGPDAIRNGADRAEILVDLDDVTVKRVITSKTSTLTVEKDGMKPSKPTTYLKELVGTSPLDPIDLYLAKAKERRAMILAALPITVAREQLLKYAPDLDPKFDCSGHGLEVVQRAHKFYYEERTAANKDADEAQREADRLSNEAMAAAKLVTPGPLVPYDAAKAEVETCSKKITELETRLREAKASEDRVAKQRDQVADLRQRADAMEKSGVTWLVDLAPLQAQRTEYATTVAELEQKLAAAKLLLAAADEKIARAKADNEASEATKNRVAELRSQANALDAALAAAIVMSPGAEEVTAATAAFETAMNTLERSKKQAAALEAAEAAEKAKLEARAAAKDASDLDAIVKALANDAPSDLLKAAEGIPGLTLKDDTVLLEGKDLDALSDSERLQFAVEIARRANTRSKILVVDRLEALDEDQREAFVRHATEGGFQLFASLVTKGELQLVAIEPEPVASAAE